MIPILIALWMLGACLGFFVLYQSLLAVVSLLPAARRRAALAPAAAPPSTRFAVLVPAHDEEILIRGTVRSILEAAYPEGAIELFVIADNCTDQTAAVAQAAGAHCLVRTDEHRRGKPYALNWAIQQLALSRYDALVIIDADTRVDSQFFRAMARHLEAGADALQGYFDVLNPDDSWLTRLSVIPATMKFRLHFPGKELLRLSCPLAGNGMCFRIDVIRRFGWEAYSLTENWEYWAQLILAGIRTGSAPDARIYSQDTASLTAGQSQRVRWMTGRMDTLRSYGGRLLSGGMRRPSAALLDAVVELARPSHAMLMVWSIVHLGGAVILTMVYPAGWPVLALSVAIMAAQLAHIILAIALERPPLRTWLSLLMVPWYLAWKTVISVQALLRPGNRAWKRTQRHVAVDDARQAVDAP
jgi:cellulose synthase/poly-beta-1,6-N-acetylglucosamine synthase-like glycosyltransferase